MAKIGRQGSQVNPPGPDTKAVPSKLDPLEYKAEGDFGALEYPANILNRTGHFIMFHIVESNPGSGTLEGVTGEQAMRLAALGATGDLTGFSIASAFDAANRLAQNQIKAGGIARAAATQEALIKQGASVTGLITTKQRRQSQRTVQTIVMYMPQKLATAYGFTYQGESLQIAAAGKAVVGLTREALGSLSGRAGNISTDVLKELGQQYGMTLTGSFLDQLGSLVGANVGARAFLEKNLGVVVNPHMQFLFKSVNQRSFEYTFHMVPETAEETRIIDNIIRTFKYFAHPELLSQAGRLHGYPAEFDIQYYSRDGDSTAGSGAIENDWLNRVGRCYLSNISVDYTGADMMSTHRHQEGVVPKDLQGASGTTNRRAGNPPTHITLSLTFNELETLNRHHIQEGF